VKLSEQEILAAIELEEAQAYGFLTGQLSEERAKALDYYNGLPFGDEEEGRSQVVLTEVSDAIEGVLPGLCKIFAGSDEVLKFEPRNGEDVAGAEQETEYCNYIVTQKNPWFQIFYIWAKDALLQKVGYVKVYWENKVDTTEETYRNLSEDELAMLLQDQEIEVIGHEQEEAIELTPQGPIPYVLHHIKVKRVNKYGQICIENVPPEEVLVSTKCRSPNPQDADFVEHRTQKTISELRASGFDIDDNAADDQPAEMFESLHRDLYAENNDWRTESNDPTMRRVWVREVYIKLDTDDSGIAELQRVVLVGSKILDMQKVEFIPFAALTPYLMPHRHIGKSIADMTMDIQLHKSKVLRNEFDGAYLALHGRHAINEDRVDLDDMLTSRPGGVVRVKGDPAGAIVPLNSPHSIGQGFPMLEYLDTVKENRTGVTKYNQGLDANSLNKTATGITKIMGAAQERQLLIARVFAETGVKNLFITVHALTRLYQNKPEVMRLRNKWVTVDPRDWVKRVDMTVSVGLGTGDKDTQLGHLQLIGQYMQTLAISPQYQQIVRPKNAYNLGVKMIENAGYKMPEEFITDPEGQDAQQQGPSPQQVQQAMQHMADLQKQLQDAQAKIAQYDQIQAQGQIKETAMSEKQKLDAYAAKLKEEEHQLAYEKEIFDLQKQLDAFQEQQESAMQDHMTKSAQEAEANKPDIPGMMQQMIEQLRQEMGGAMQMVMQETTKKPVHLQKVRDNKGKLVKVVSHYEDGTTRETGVGD
jgi:hypothetical protein